MEKREEKNFEIALEELEGVVEQLETGELPLEESLVAFERGVGLVVYCNDKLTEAEKRVELLVKDKEGKMQFKVLDAVALRDEGRRRRIRRMTSSLYCPRAEPGTVNPDNRATSISSLLTRSSLHEKSVLLAAAPNWIWHPHGLPAV
jgi:exodeoxyribonuclease VII small subunit